jgi:AcrR family transcriptional regulator
MADDEHLTKEKIVHAALALFFEQGIKKTSVAEVAHRAGVTRVTVYRYFADKRDLVRAAFLRTEQVFQQGLAELEQDPDTNWERALDRIGEGLSALPAGDLSIRLDELKRLYPAIYAEFQEVRVAALEGIFTHVFAAAERQGRLRPGLNREIVQTVYWQLVINFFDSPQVHPLGRSNAEMYYAVKDILLYGILETGRNKDEALDDRERR